ncbi:MAG: L7Ae/L30e/S12e/Gadd45 family ribosomal protein [Oscillospiraceae bacterium]|jgi:ribosomal protein L7Ae-like RNA K-turn-binding protein
MNNKARNYLAIAMKAGTLEIGEENAGAAVRHGKAKVLLLASDASGNARRRAEGFVYGVNVSIVKLPFTKEEIASSTGKSGCSMAAVTDIGLAKSIVESLAADDAQYEEIAKELAEKYVKVQRRKEEARSHERNKRTGKRRK